MIKTEKPGWNKIKASLVNSDEDSLESYKKQKNLFRRISSLEKDVEELKSIIRILSNVKTDK